MDGDGGEATALDKLAFNIRTCTILPEAMAKAHSAAVEMGRGIHAVSEANPGKSALEIASAQPEWLEAIVNYSSAQSDLLLMYGQQAAALEAIVDVLKETLEPRLTADERQALVQTGLYHPLPDQSAGSA